MNKRVLFGTSCAIFILAFAAIAAPLVEYNERGEETSFVTRTISLDSPILSHIYESYDKISIKTLNSNEESTECLLLAI
jgi:hypothetical protein